MQECNKVQEQISLYIDGVLEIKEKRDFEEHIKECAKCKEELETTLKMIELCGEMEEEELPQGFSEELHGKLIKIQKMKTSREQMLSRFSIYAKIGSSIAAVIIFMVYYYGGFTMKKDLKSQNSLQSAQRSLENTESSTSVQTGSTAKEEQKNKKSKEDEVRMSFSMALPDLAQGDVNATEDINKSAKEVGSKEPSSSADVAKSTQKPVLTGGEVDAVNFDKSSEELKKESTTKDGLEVVTTALTLKQQTVSTKIKKNLSSNDLDFIKEQARLGGGSLLSESTSTAKEERTVNKEELRVKVESVKYEEFKKQIESKFGKENVSFSEIRFIDLEGQIQALNQQIASLEHNILKIEEKEGEQSKETNALKKDIEIKKAEITKLTGDARMIEILVTSD